MRQTIHKATTHAPLTTMNVTVRIVEVPHVPHVGCDRSVTASGPSVDSTLARTVGGRDTNMRFHSARKTMYPIANIASSQIEFPGPTTSEIAMSITTHDDAKIGVLALLHGTAIPKGNNIAPAIANATNDAESAPLSNVATINITTGNKLRPNPTNPAACTRWRFNRTAYIGPNRAVNVANHNNASARPKANPGDDLVATRPSPSVSTTSKVN